MKTRDGFVSNSSSTSFTVVLSKDAPVDERLSAASVFDFVTKLANGDMKMTRSTVEEKRAYIKQELEQLEKDRPFLVKKVKRIEKYLSDKKLVEMVDLIHESDTKLEHIRYQRDKGFKATPTLEFMKMKTQDLITELDKRISELKEMRDALTTFDAEDSVVSWEEDNWGTYRFIVDEMLDSGMLTVLERKSS